MFIFVIAFQCHIVNVCMRGHLLVGVSVTNDDVKQGIIISLSQKNGSKRGTWLSGLCNHPYLYMIFFELAGPKRWVVEGASVAVGASRDTFTADIS